MDNAYYNNYSLISIASYEVITSYEDIMGKPPTGLYFNKMMSLVHSTLKEDRLDLGLPHCWYRWGDEVVRYHMPNQIKWNHEEPQYTKVTWQGNIPKGLGNDAYSKMIQDVVNKLTDKYCDADGIEKAVSDVYSNAPFEFQRKFRFCRETFKSKIQSGIDLQNYGKQFLWPALKDAFSTFPHDDFPMVAEKIEPFLDIMEIMLNNESVDYRYANEISEEFWIWFCYYLRIHPSCHENVPNSTIDYWRECIPVENDRYLRLLGDHISIIQKEGSRTLSPKLLAIVSERYTEIEKENIIFDSFENEMGDFESYITHIKGKYQSK